MCLGNEGYWVTSAMLGNKGNQCPIYLIIWDNGKSIYKYYIEIQTLLFSPDSSLSRECQYLPPLTVLGKDCRLRTGNRHVFSLYRYIVGLHDKIYLYKDALISSTFLTMMAALLKYMFIYYQCMMLDDKSFRKCVCVLAATLTRSKINWELNESSCTYVLGLMILPQFQRFPIICIELL